MGLYGNGVSGKVEGEGEGGIYEELDMGEGEGGYDPESIWGDEGAFTATVSLLSKIIRFLERFCS